MSETAKIRSEVLNYCVGKGVDLGCGGDKVTPDAIGFDLPRPYTKVGEDAIDVSGDARRLRYGAEEFDYVYSSHLLEDFPNTHEVLTEWWRVLKVDGYMILYLPHEMRFRAHCASTGQGYNQAHSVEDMSLGYMKNIFKHFSCVIVKEIDCHEIYSFLLVVRKEESGELAVQPMSGMHTGDMGDVIYSLPAAKKLGITKYLLNPEPLYNSTMGLKLCNKMIPFLRTQGLEAVIYTGNEFVSYNLDAYRETGEDMGITHLALTQAKALQVDVDLSVPYVHLTPAPAFAGEDIVVVHRSLRYHNPEFDWQRILHPLGKIVCVGHHEEYVALRNMTGYDFEYVETETILDLARVIAAAKVFIGNQSMPFALAEAMKINRIQETCTWVPNAIPQSHNGIAVTGARQMTKAMSFLRTWMTGD